MDGSSLALVLGTVCCALVALRALTATHVDGVAEKLWPTMTRLQPTLASLTMAMPKKPALLVSEALVGR